MLAEHHDRAGDRGRARDQAFDEIQCVRGDTVEAGGGVALDRGQAGGPGAQRLERRGDGAVDGGQAVAAVDVAGNGQLHGGGEGSGDRGRRGRLGASEGEGFLQQRDLGGQGEAGERGGLPRGDRGAAVRVLGQGQDLLGDGFGLAGG